MSRYLEMNRAIVIAVVPDGSLFAVETEAGYCAVFRHCGGPEIQAGDVLDGAVTSRGEQLLNHPAGRCEVVGASGPVSRQAAMSRLADGMAGRDDDLRQT